MIARFLSILFFLSSIFLVGCLPSWSVDWADRDAYGALREGQAAVLGEAADFDIEYAPIDVREFLTIVDTQLGDSGGTQILHLEDALKLAYRNSRDFQSTKEDLYSSALSLVTLSRGWSTLLFSGDSQGTTEVARTAGGGPEGGPDQSTKYLNASTGATLAKRLVGGGLIVLGASLDYAIDFVGGSDTEVLGSLVSGTFTQPLLRGAFRNLAYEEQYRRERDFLVEVFEFYRFRQLFAVQIFRDYYGVLRSRDRIENSRIGIKRLQEAYDVTRTLVDGGQVSPVQRDQAEQDLLNAQIGLELALLNYSNALDSFKITLGVPISSDLRLDYPKALEDLNEAGPKPFPFTESESVEIALSSDTRLLRARARARDSTRDVEIAADRFLPGVEFEAGISVPGTAPDEPERLQWHHHTRNVRLNFQYDLDQTENRNRYRNALIDRDRAARNLIQEQHSSTLAVRNSFRSLKQSRQSFLLQAKSATIADRRTKLAAIQRKEGAASARDVLEAENARIFARNGQTNALIDYTITRLEFLADLGMLSVDSDGLYSERNEPFGFDRLEERYSYLSPDSSRGEADEDDPSPRASASSRPHSDIADETRE